MKKVIGYFLFVLSFMAWAAIASLPFLNLSIEKSAAITTALIVGGEIAFVISIALLGKEFLGKLNQTWDDLVMAVNKARNENTHQTQQ
jgi:hypothetical protein